MNRAEKADRVDKADTPVRLVRHVRLVRPTDAPSCNRCGFPVSPAPWGCKNPCANCGTVYPLGDCSD